MSHSHDWTPTRRTFIGTSFNAFAAAAAVSAGLKFGTPTAAAESITPVLDQYWTRKHDRPGVPFTTAARTYYPQSLQDLIQLCKDPGSGSALHAAGSHWALSTAAVSKFSFVETHDPREDTLPPILGEARPAMGQTLTGVVPDGLSEEYLDWLNARTKDDPPRQRPHYLVHVEAGKRIYQLYAELDQPVDLTNRATLGGHMAIVYGNNKFGGPWGPATLGGAGGQTVVGAFTTGTHGGDFDRPPIADSIVAMHLVADGGNQYWIEPTPTDIPALTSDVKLRQLYGVHGHLDIIRDDDFFNAVLVSVGRFGIIYSVIVRAVPQYNLIEQRDLYWWDQTKANIKNQSSWLYRRDRSSLPDQKPVIIDSGVKPPPQPGMIPPGPAPGAGSQGSGVPLAPEGILLRPPRFLQIVICLTPTQNFTRNIVGITQRWEIDLPPDPGGRASRVGTIINDYDPLIKAPRFSNAGRNFAYSKSPEPGLLESACVHSSLIAGLFEEVTKDIEDLLTTGTATGVVANLLPIGVGPGIATFFAALWVILQLLKEFIKHMNPDGTLAGLMDEVRALLLDNPLSFDHHVKGAGLCVWQLIAAKIFDMLQGTDSRNGISYAIMDIHNYRDHSCDVDVDSIEVFFDATSDNLIAYCDALIDFERKQEYEGKAALGYASLRFMGPSRALLAEQLWPRTCSVEVAVLKGVKGSQELVDYAVEKARDPLIGGYLHWGQRNTYNRDDVSGRYKVDNRLAKWRSVLASVTNNGANNRFSNDFTQQCGLELS